MSPSYTLPINIFAVMPLQTSVWESTISVIAVHGLGSNSPDAWTHPVSSKNWLKDFLPHAIPDARILVVNHDSKWRSNASVQTLSDYGESLLSSTRLVRRTDTALNIASARLHDPDHLYRSIFSSTRGILFLGTPHGGSSYAAAGRFSARLATVLGSRTELFDFIDPGSHLLSELNDTFLRSYSDCGIFCFFEAQPPTNSLGLRQPLVSRSLSTNGAIRRRTLNGHRAQVVEKAAAIIPGRPHEVLNLDHMALNKFVSEHDQNYQKVSQVVTQLVNSVKSPRLSSPLDLSRGMLDGTGYLDAFPFRGSESDPLRFEQSNPGLTQAMPSKSESIKQARLQKEQLQKEDDLLGMLQPQTLPLHEAEVVTRHHGTCEWITRNEAFQKWDKSDPSSCNFLLIAAPPGWGKSVLAKHLLRTQRVGAEDNADEMVLGYFCKNREGQDSASAIIRSFIYRLLCAHRELFRHVLPFYTPHKLSESTLSFKTLWTMFVAVMSDPSLQVRLIIDGLDECRPAAQQELMRALESSLQDAADSGLRGKILVTSRPTPIAVEFGTRLGILHMSLDDVAPDISAIVHAEVDKLALGRGLPDDISYNIKHKLESKAEGMFLWVGLVLEELQRDDYPDTRKAIDHILDNCPQNLGDFYLRDLERIPLSSRAPARRLYQILLIAPKALSPGELAVLFTEWPSSCGSLSELEEHLPLNIGRYTKATCGSLIRVTDSTIGFVHQSARDVLTWLTSPEQIDLPGLTFDLTAAHLSAFKACLRYLLIADLPRSDASTQYSLPPDPPFLEYAIAWWSYHARGAGSLDEESRDLLARFFVRGNRILEQWIERVFRAHFDSAVLDLSRDRFDSVLGAVILSGLAPLLMSNSIGKQPPPSDPAATRPALGKLEVDFDTLDCAGTNALTIAAAYDYVDVAQHLLKQGANPNITIPRGFGILHYAVKSAMADLLLDAGAAIECRSDDGMTPLHVTAMAGNGEVVGVLLSRKANVDARDMNGATPLSLAMARGHIEVVTQLLSAGADIRRRVEFDGTMIFSAAQSEKTELMDLVLSSGLIIEDQGDGGITPLYPAACLPNGTVCLEYLLSLGANVGHRARRGQTPLHWAAYAGRPAAIRLLLEHGSDVNAIMDQEVSPLYLAATRGDYDVVQTLLERGADIHAISMESRFTPLYPAVMTGTESIVSLMIQSGSNVRHRAAAGSTPLHLACRGGKEAIVRSLVDAGADIDALDDARETPLMLAVNSGRHTEAEMLLELGADPNVQCKAGAALHLATREQSLDLVATLIRKGADVSVTTSTQATPLHLAASDGSLAIAETLLSAHADVEAKEQLGYRPLHYAAWAGETEMVEKLVEAGADVDVLANNQRTPLHLAAMSGHAGVTEILMDAYATIDSPDEEGTTPMEAAAANGHLSVTDLLRRHVPQEQSPSDTSTMSKAVLGPVAARQLDPEVSQRKESLQRAVDEAKAEGVPAAIDWQKREKYFLAKVAEGEEFCTKNEDDAVLKAAVSFYKAFKVYPQPRSLLRIYDKTVPQGVLAMLYDMLRLDPDVEAATTARVAFAEYLPLPLLQDVAHGPCDATARLLPY
ncbi:MAG: hypothetical protein M1817_003028 [Caeruleum heppii]|nr:MAG: hypothetical protein M1817_003028 [Caeruleum heppii]